ncbi:hypothetical protein R1sor_000122 [Riccia sorocarpa]|uniref:Uncharacterized protein n=1 Tax=Riccia sorocarpa TaxID=122646 RepID=A0ABD3GVD8_9MARC
MAASSEQSKNIDAQEDFSSVAEVQRALRGEGGTPRSRTVRVTVSGTGHNGVVYRGCPTCQISERRGYGHAYGIAEWLFRLKLIVKDPSGELEVTSWETAKHILGMELDDFVAVQFEPSQMRSMEAPRTPERMVVPAFSLAAGVTSQAEMASVSTGGKGSAWS